MCVAFVCCMLCRVLRLKHVPIINRINPLLCLLIHFPYEFKSSCFLGHLNHKIPSGFSKHAIWNFSVFTRTVWPSGRAHTLSLFIFLFLSLILLIISQTLFSFTSSFHSHTHTTSGHKNLCSSQCVLRLHNAPMQAKEKER